jgi:hypothetical protein
MNFKMRKNSLALHSATVTACRCFFSLNIYTVYMKGARIHIRPKCFSLFLARAKVSVRVSIHGSSPWTLLSACLHVICSVLVQWLVVGTPRRLIAVAPHVCWLGAGGGGAVFMKCMNERMRKELI